MPEASTTTCPHCGTALTPLELPEVLFAHASDLACFNDECPYYVRGWAWMQQQYGVKASYRYRVDGETGHVSPLAVRGHGPTDQGVLPGDAAGKAGEHP